MGSLCVEEGDLIDDRYKWKMGEKLEEKEVSEESTKTNGSASTKRALVWARDAEEPSVPLSLLVFVSSSS